MTKAPEDLHQVEFRSDDDLTAFDIFLWHVINLGVGGCLGVFSMLKVSDGAASSSAVLAGVFGVGVAATWTGGMLLLTQFGFWDWLGRALSIIFWPLKTLTIILVAPFILIFELLIRAVIALFGIALFLFLIVGIAGILWFGVQQFF